MRRRGTAVTKFLSVWAALQVSRFLCVAGDDLVEACCKNNERQVDVTITASAWQQMRRTRRTEPRRIRVLGADGFDGAKILEVQFEAKKHLRHTHLGTATCVHKNNTWRNVEQLEN